MAGPINLGGAGGGKAPPPQKGGGAGPANLGRHLRNIFRMRGVPGGGKAVKMNGKGKVKLEYRVGGDVGGPRLAFETLGDAVTVAAVAVLPAAGGYNSALQLPFNLPLLFRKEVKASRWTDSAHGAITTTYITTPPLPARGLTQTARNNKASPPRDPRAAPLAQPTTQPTTSITPITPTALYVTNLPELTPCSDAARGGEWALTPTPEILSRLVYLDDVSSTCTSAPTAIPTDAPTTTLVITAPVYNPEKAQAPPVNVFNWQRIQLLKLLGSGSFGDVQQARLLGSKGQRDMYVAVKTPKAGLVGAEALLLKEARLLAHLRHPNLLRVYGLTRSPVALVMEVLPAGTLGAALERRKGRPVRAEVRHTVSRGVAAALQHLHTQSPPVVHRDLSSANVLLAKGWQPRVCDFGLSRRKEASALAASAAGDGTPAYMAPEVLSSGRVTEKADVYSFGVLLWELVTGKTPWAEHTSFQVIYQVCIAGNRLEVPANCPGRLAELMRSCWDADPLKRPCFTHILHQLDACAPRRPSTEVPAMAM